jgi:SAM-dependent methyltransferase
VSSRQGDVVDGPHEREWAQAVESWTRWQPRWSQMTEPLDQALMEAAGVDPGMEVLDLACGTGDPAVALARAVGPTGRVTALDPVEGMLEAARLRFEDCGLANIRVQRLSLGRLPFADQSFDAVTCRFGLVYADDPVLAVSEMRRVLREGCRAAIMVWGAASRNEYWSVERDALARLPLPDPRPLEDPVEFNYASPGSLAAVLGEGGLHDVEERVLTMRLRWPGPPEELWQQTAEDIEEMNVPAAMHERFADEVRHGYSALAHGGGVLLRSEVVLGVGTGFPG